MQENEILIFTDGASRGNPGFGGYGWIAVYENDGVAKVEEGGGRETETTNNRMELSAAIKALSSFDEKKSFRVYCDSAYVVNGITKWVFGWEKNGWKTSLKQPVMNEDLWKEFLSATRGKKIEWKLIKGHAGHSGNERCDEIATAFADSLNGGDEPELFKGNLSDYKVDILNMSEPNFTASKSKKSSSKAKAYSYVSSVDGLVMVHQTWEECEKRVKGVKGAKYKKALNKGQEEELRKSLGNL